MLASNNALVIDPSYNVTEGCSLTCSGDYDSVSIEVRGCGKSWDLILDTDEARRLIFRLHRAVTEALTVGV